jgi:hypothetical protein
MNPQPYSELSDTALLALCEWREADDQGVDGMRGKCDLPLNRFCHRVRPAREALSPRHREVKERSYYDAACRQCAGKKQRAKLRLEFLKEFGGKCSCCGETHPLFLTLEHINGQDHKASKATHFQLQIAKREKWDKKKYECLCIACNWAKGIFGQCPHRSGVTPEQTYKSLERDARNVTESGHRSFTDAERLRGQQSRRKLTEEQVKEVMRLALLGESQRKIAAKFNVTKSTICLIVSGKRQYQSSAGLVN